MFYSAQKNAWFDPAFADDYKDAGAWPDDAVEYDRSVFDSVVTNRPADQFMISNDGHPSLIGLPELTPNQIVLRQIAELEISISARRIREAVLGIDSGWLAGVNDKISVLREQLLS